MSITWTFSVYDDILEPSYHKLVVHMVDQNINNFLSKLGLSSETASVYLALLNKPAQSAQTIAKEAGVPKTTVYRRLEELVTLGLVEEQIEEYKKLYQCSPVETLKLLITKKEQEAKELSAQLPEIVDLFSATKSLDPETKVLFYRGVDGIKQMNWNVIKTKGEFCGYTFRTWEEIVGDKYVSDFYEKFLENGFSGREIYSQEYLKSRKNVSSATKWKNWESRYLDPKIVNVIHQMDIYNDVVAIYNWHEGEVFGIEIYNTKIASMQKQIFEVLWGLSKSPKSIFKK